MKKHLLLSAATLMCVSTAWADVRYFQDGEPLSGTAAEVISKMKAHPGALYCLQFNKQEAPRSGFLYSANTSSEQFHWNYDGVTAMSPAGEANANKIFRLEFVDGTDNFTVQNLYSNHYISIQGRANTGRHNAQATDGTGAIGGRPLTIGQFTVADKTDASILKDDDPLKENRYLIKMTNATFDNGGSQTVYWQSYNEKDPVSSASFAFVSYQTYTTGNQTAQVVFYPVKASESTPITVNFPDWNGVGMTLEVQAYEGQSAEPYILELAQEYGGIEEATVSSVNGSDLIVSATNKEFTVTGNWKYDFEANIVYRISLKPGDSPTALRYMLDAEEIRNNIGGDETLSRLIPERLWFFKPGEKLNTFSLHNLYKPEWAVSFTPNAQGSYNNAKAVYGEEVTYFNLVHKSTDNQFYLKIDGTEDAYVNDYANNGYFSIYHTSNPDENCILQIFPLEARDMEALGLPENTIPSAENEQFLKAVEDYNAKNIAAALRRIGYWGGEDLIGWQPGRFNNETNDFLEKLANARQLQSQIDAGQQIEESVALQAVEDIDFRNLQFKEIEPGKFYRFKNKKSGKYLSSDAWGQLEQNGKTYNLMKLVDEDKATYPNTIFYLDGTTNGEYTLVSFETGLVIPDFDSTTSNWVPMLTDADNAGHVFKIQHQHLGGCILCSSVNGAHRHLHGGGNVSNSPGAVNVSGNTATDEHQWYVELVEELPLTFYNVFGQDDNEGWTSVYSPVALEIPAKYTHTTAYTGEFDDADYTGKNDVNHVLATPIDPNDEGKVIIPANQPALIFYDGKVDVENNPNLEQGTDDENRSHIVYLNLPVVFDRESNGEIKGNLKAGFCAFANDDNKEFFTLHASTNNNFRVYEEFDPNAQYIPGFKAYLDEIPALADGEEKLFPIYTINPNTMVPLQDNEGYTTAIDESDPTMLIITLTTPANDYDVYYKHTTTASSPAAPQRRAAAVDHSGYTLAEHQEGTNVHKIRVPNGNIEYYAYHAESNFKGVVRSATVNTTGIDAVVTAGATTEVYDLQGRKLAAPAKGFNIINGRKVLVK